MKNCINLENRIKPEIILPINRITVIQKKKREGKEHAY